MTYARQASTEHLHRDMGIMSLTLIPKTKMGGWWGGEEVVGMLPQADDVLALNGWAREGRDAGRTVTALPLLNGGESYRGQEHTHGREEEEGILETDGCKF